MLAELLEQHHCQQAGARPAAGNHMERCRWLTDLLAVPAGDLLTHRLDDLPAARNDFERLGDVFTDPAQAGAAASRASAGRRNDDALARQMLRKRLAGWSAPFKAGCSGGLASRQLSHCLVLAGRGFQLLELKLELVQQAAAPLRPGAEKLVLELLDLQLEMRDQCLVIGPLGPSAQQCRLSLVGPHGGRCQSRLEGFYVIGHGRNTGLHGDDGIIAMLEREAENCAKDEKKRVYPARVGRQLCCGLRQSIPSSR